MTYYEINLHGIPKFQFASSVTVKNYNNTFQNRPSFLEICVQEAGEILYQYADKTEEVIQPGMLIPIFSDMNCVTSAVNGQPQSHTCVGVDVSYTCEKKDTAGWVDLAQLTARVKSEGLLLIPFHESLNKEEFSSVLSMLKQIVSYVHSPYPCDSIQAVSVWFRLCSLLTKIVLTRIEQLQFPSSPSVQQYASKAKEFIAAHYKEAITVSDIAGALKISPGYLHSVFRTATGMGVIAFLNQHRIEIAKQLIEHSHLPLQETAEQVGIKDAAYMSRLFKKTTGMCYREYLAKLPERIHVIV